MDNETNNLLKQLEDENGGKLVYKTYALFLGISGEGAKNLGGLFYIVNGRLIFEDFEKQGGLLQMFVKREEKYEKTKFSFPVDDIAAVHSVVRSSALKAVRGTRAPDKTIPASGLRKFLNRTITQIFLNNGKAYYFELIDEKAFREFIKL